MKNFLIATAVSPSTSTLPGSDSSAAVVNGVLFYALLLFLTLGVLGLLVSGVLWIVGAVQKHPTLTKVGKWATLGIAAFGIVLFLIIILVSVLG